MASGLKQVGGLNYQSDPPPPEESEELEESDEEEEEESDQLELDDVVDSTSIAVVNVSVKK